MAEVPVTTMQAALMFLCTYVCVHACVGLGLDLCARVRASTVLVALTTVSIALLQVLADGACGQLLRPDVCGRSARHGRFVHLLADRRCCRECASGDAADPVAVRSSAGAQPLPNARVRSATVPVAGVCGDSPTLFCPHIQLFAGFFIPITSIPVWLRWAQYLCSLKYSLNLLIVVEFENLPDSWPSAYSSDNYYDAVCTWHLCRGRGVARLSAMSHTLRARVMPCRFRRTDGCSGADLVDGDCIESARVGNSYDSALFPRSEVSVNEVGFYLAILCGALVFFRVLALIALVFKARRH